MWETLSTPWQAALEMAWEAYCSGTIPIGAVVADMDGNVVSRGRNRVNDSTAPNRQICNNELAHAEMNALLSLTLSYEECEHVALYTTMEPCPLCMGALYMSDIKTLHFAAHDPWAGSTNLLGTTPYLSRKPIKIFEPFDLALEEILTAMLVEHTVHFYGEQSLSNRFFEQLRETIPNSVEMGIALYRSNELRKKQKGKLPASEIINWLAHQVQ